MKLAEARAALKFCNSYSRLPKILEIADQMQFSKWLRLLGENWTDFDNVSEHLDDLYCRLEGLSSVEQMMDREERRIFASLPDIVQIYRGCGRGNVNGISWSLSKETAEKFPFLNRYLASEPVLVTANVRKDDIIALKNDRAESEIITIDPDIVSVEPISEERGRDLMREHAHQAKTELELFIKKHSRVRSLHNLGSKPALLIYSTTSDSVSDHVQIWKSSR